MYFSSFDEDFILLRADGDKNTDSPYRPLYHEYTHAILRLNFRDLPAWLSEGISEYYGNTAVQGDEIELGHVNAAELQKLQSASLLPIRTLMSVDHESRFYNDKTSASVFYAESWMLVHYFMLDTDASKARPLLKYFDALQSSDGQDETAAAVFGDSAKLQGAFQQYAMQKRFRTERFKTRVQVSEASVTAREMTDAEALALEADFFQHSGRFEAAQVLLNRALEMQPQLAAAHTDLGYDDYLQFEDNQAEREFSEAIETSPRDFRAMFYLAELNYRRHGYSAESTPEIVAQLEKALKIDPDFAPACAFIAIAYLHQPETREKALDAALKAHQIEPTELPYLAVIGSVLLGSGRMDDANAMQRKLNSLAKTPQEKSFAHGYAQLLAQHEEFVARRRIESVKGVKEEELPPDFPDLQPGRDFEKKQTTSDGSPPSAN
jgi:tetratricopeptide (TPR) repeat protein